MAFFRPKKAQFGHFVWVGKCDLAALKKPDLVMYKISHHITVLKSYFKYQNNLLN